MKNLISTLLIIFSFSVISFAQENTVCPNIEIFGPNSAVQPGETMKFIIPMVTEVEKLNLKFEWDLDKGEIISGQGTNQIIVSTDGLSDETITASVKFLGLPKNCNSNFSETGIIVGIPPICTLDEFGDLARDDVFARMDAFLMELQNNPNAIGYILNYGQPKDVVKREKIIREHIKHRKYDESRIIILYKDEEESIRTRLYILPAGFDISEID